MNRSDLSIIKYFRVGFGPARRAIPMLLAAFMFVGCDYSSFIPDRDIQDVQYDDLPFYPPDDWEPSDDGSAGFIITSATPLTGPVRGGTRVTIEGRGFRAGSTVLFGPLEGIETVVENEYTIKATSPAWTGYSKTVDLYVVRPDGKKTVLRPGFRYQSPVVVASVHPRAGPTMGGTPITVSGSGFGPDATVVVDGRAALKSIRMDDATILAVTPPGESGDVDVTVVTGDTSTGLGRGFAYFDPPTELVCSPTIVDMNGTSGDRLSVIQLSGLNLNGIDSISLSNGKVASLVVEGPESAGFVADFSGVEGGGPVNVTVAGPGGTVVTRSCFTALEKDDIDSPALKIHAVKPQYSPLSGGISATMTVTGLDTGNPSSLLARVDGVATPVNEVPDMNTVVFTVPPGAPGPADVKLESPTESATIGKAIIYRTDAAVTGVSPSSAPATGRTPATVVGHGLSGAVEVLVGPLPARIDATPADDAIQITLPAAGPGVHDVTVTLRDGTTLVARDAITFAADHPGAVAIWPNRGSLAGGTLVYVTGSGLVSGTRVFFGRYEAVAASTDDPGRMAVISPAGDNEGTVDVHVVDSDGVRQTLSNAFTYFNPTGFLGGTWGAPISGAVNVTVIDSYNDTPIPQAFVMIGSDPETPFKGFTDGRGMLTMSGRGLRGPVMVTATRQDYTTWSVVGVDAENITLYLEPLYNQPPPDNGNGEGENVFPLNPGLVSGRVTGTDKEFIAPPVSCSGMPLTNGSMCYPCESDDDCDEDGVCVLTGPTAMTCSRACEIGTECPRGWDCYQGDGSGGVCKPSPGQEQVRCGISDSSSARWSDPFGPGATMSPQQTFILNSRLGDVAVYCLGGYLRSTDGEFVPVIMGVERHVPVGTASITTGIDVRLQIPLNRSLRLRMVAPPEGPEAPPVRLAAISMYLGSDGYLNLWPAQTGNQSNAFVFERLPASFDGPLEGVSMSVASEFDPPGSLSEPYSLVYPEDFDPSTPLAVRIESDHTTRIDDTMAIDAIGACHSAAGGIVIDSFHRAWMLDPTGSISALPSIGYSDITDCAWLDDGRIVFTGSGSRVYTYDPVLMTFATDYAGAGTRTLNLTARCGETTWVAGQGKLFARNDQDGTWLDIAYGSPSPISSLTCEEGGRVIGTGSRGMLFSAGFEDFSTIRVPGMTRDLHCAVFTGDAWFVAGDRGVILTGPSLTGLKPIASGLLDDITTCEAAANGSVLLGGSRGLVAVTDGVDVTVLRAPKLDVQMMAFVPVPGATDGSTGTVTLGMAGNVVMAGPFMNIPVFTSPLENWLWLDDVLEWDIATPPSPSFFYVRLYTVGVSGRWSIIADGSVRRFKLPNVGLASGLALDPIKPGVVSIFVYSILSDGFDIDHYDSTSLYTNRWQAWSATGFTTKGF